MIGVGALPRIVPNSELDERLGIDAEWIVERSGIEAPLAAR